MDGTCSSSSSPFFSSLQSDFSTGYLQDALLEFNQPSKRRRLLFSNQTYLNENCGWDITSVHDEMMSNMSEEANAKREISVVPETSERMIKRVRVRVVYPFALIKPGGREGEMSIKDINERILMAPTRPVRHPVGEFACRPCVSAAGPGLSGKAIVALTRIHTQGRGTITIIRTKG
ncbi:uncharacterized protein [Euphorbia lathyris]|uniref:uncharacterized protein n=1 Tax=Euphorbia lathyris TaxID=212925 RepID=UPI003314310C